MSTQTLYPMTMTPHFTIHDRLRKAREAAGLEQQELADRMEVSRGSISNHERAATSAPRPTMVRKWARATGVSYDWLQHGDAATDAAGQATRAQADGAASALSRMVARNVQTLLALAGWGAEVLAPICDGDSTRAHALVFGAAEWSEDEITAASALLGVPSEWLLRLRTEKTPAQMLDRGGVARPKGLEPLTF
ncbi:MAG: helix-turn-helix transcriptional regulator [Buchananella hordeovulneris]|nr:helix-turn-helix transcriptional regulator [Buchananella hordeovulneris]